MDLQEKEILIYRILSGTIRLNSHIIKPASIDLRYKAAILYKETYESSIDELYTEIELLDFLLDHDFWGESEQKRMEGIEKDLEELKYKLYYYNFQGKEKEKTKAAIAKANHELAKLHEQRHHYDYLGAAGYANIIKTKYLIARCLYNENNIALFPNDEVYFNYTGNLINDIIDELRANTISESNFRELARTDPWRSIWMIKKVAPIIPSCLELTDEQRSLMVWSSIYDNIYESPDCPSDDIINDDDKLDGWMIAQRRKRKKELAERKVDEVIGDARIKNADEIYIPVNSSSSRMTAEEVELLNDSNAAALKKRKLALMKRKEVTREVEMPDAQEKLRTLMNQRYRESMRR